MARCTAKTSVGKRCRHNQTEGSSFCAQHKKIHEERAIIPDQNGWDDSIFDDIPDMFAEVSSPQPPAPSQATESIHIEKHIENPLEQQVVYNIFQIDDINAMIEEVTMKLAKLNKVKRIIITANNEIENKAKWMFYHANKNNTVLMTELRTKLQSCGLYLVKNNKEVIPYVYIKEYTDNAFAGLSSSDKVTYYDRAKEKIYGKVQMARAQICN